MASSPVLNYQSTEDWDTVLLNFADSLHVHPDLASLGSRLCGQVEELLMKNLSLSVALFNSARTDIYLGGSLASGTDVLTPEYVMVLKLDPSLEYLRDRMMSVMMTSMLNESEHLSILKSTIKLTPKRKFSLSYIHKSGIKVTIRLGSVNDHYLEDYDKFLAEQSVFTRAVVKFMRLWFDCKSTFFDLKDDNLWKIIELVTVAAASLEEAENGDSFTAALKRTLEQLMNIESVKISFHRAPQDTWTLGNNTSSIKLTFKKESKLKWAVNPGTGPGSDCGSKTGRYLIDPVNNTDLLVAVNIEQKLYSFVRFAKGAKSALISLLERVHTVKYKGRWIVEFDKYFEPLPASLKGIKGADPTLYGVQFELSPSAEGGRLPEVKIMKLDLFHRNELVRTFTLTFMEYLVAVSQCILRQSLNPDEAQANVERGIKKFIKNYIPDANERDVDAEARNKIWTARFRIPIAPYGLEPKEKYVTCVKVWLAF